MSDGLDDLEAVMGQDYGFGYDDELGDPNIMPKVPPAPQEVMDKRTHESIALTFPAQQQFLDWLTVQLVALTPSVDPNKPFAKFSASAAENRTYTCKGEEAREVTHVMLKGLLPGTQYVARLVVHNPSGTVQGKSTGILLTPPGAPPAPSLEPVLTKYDCQLHVRFPALGQNLTRLVVQCVEEAEGAEAFDDHERVIEAVVASPQVSTERRVERLRPGMRYIVRLHAINAAGSTVGEVAGPVITHPRAHQLIEDVPKRTSHRVGFRFDDHGQGLTALRLAYTSGKDKEFKRAQSMNIADPQQAQSCVVDNLDPDVLYSFRLVAENESGTQNGPMCQVRTTEYTPELHDKSGWLHELPDMSGRKTLGRRLSLRKSKPKRNFYVLDAKLLTWYTEPDGKELGFIHLGKVTSVSHEPGSVGFAIYLKDGKRKEYTAESVDPNVTSEDLCAQWVECLQGAVEHRPSSITSRQDSVSNSHRSTARGSPEDMQTQQQEAPHDGGTQAKQQARTTVLSDGPVANPTSIAVAPSPPLQEAVHDEDDEESFGF